MGVHHEHGHGSTTTVVDGGDREGPATALIVLIAILAIGALIWFFAFSGVVIDRDSGGGGDVNIQQNDPPAQQNAPDVTQNNTNTEPAPTST